MKVLLAVHGYPPELVAGTEKSVQATARGIVRAGHEAVVVAGSIDWEAGFRTTSVAERDPESGRSIAVHRIHRADLYFDHWQKSRSVPVARAFREILRAERPDVVHVHHWIRLSRDLVAVAAQEGMPAVVTLHDLWVSCPIAFRVRLDNNEYCDVPPGADPCVACAGVAPVRTPWLSERELGAELDARQRDLRRELELARAVLCLSRSHAERLDRYLGLAASGVELEPLVLGHDHPVGRAERPPPPAELGRLVLGTWGALSPVKGVDVVLDALERLPPGLPVELHVAGVDADPGYADRLRERARGRPVHFHGRFEGHLAERTVTRVHAMVSGTRAEESWGLVVDEALALGLPMILPRSGAYPEHFPGLSAPTPDGVGDGQGVLFYEPRDAASLAQAIDRMRADPNLAETLRRALPAVTDVVPSVRAYTERLLHVYERAVRAGPPAAPPRDVEDEAAAERRSAQWDADLQRSGS